jgi:hypothetical protein
MKIFALVLLAISILACHQTVKKEQEPPISMLVHQDSVLGWTLEIPSNWKIKTAKEIAELNQKGIESMENVVGTEMDVSLFSNCLSFAKDSVNMFQSVREKYADDETGWKKNNAALKALFCDVYANQGVRVDSSETTIEEIGGINFHCYEILFYNDKQAITMSQLFYSTLYKGYDFSVSMCANNEKDKQELISIWENSVFKKD